MEAALAYAVWLLCVCSLGNVQPVDSTHFMGGLIRWIPVNPAAFDGLVSEEEALKQLSPFINGFIAQFILSSMLQI